MIKNRLTTTVAGLKNGSLDLHQYLDGLCDLIDARDSDLQAFIAEPCRRSRLHGDAEALQSQFPDSSDLPPLYGVPVGVKDLYRVNGFPTKAGSRLPAEVFSGQEASCIGKLRALGGLILGKLVTTEFASRPPGPTRNPHNVRHTPGGSSSGSAAAVAAGYCPLAFGTQTVGSTIRPAAFCGVVGFKPSLGRIPIDGIVPFSPSSDHVGLFTQDAPSMRLAASALIDDWRPARDRNRVPTLGIPEGAYLNQIPSDSMTAFEAQVESLKRRGHQVKRVAALGNIEVIRQQHRILVDAEFAMVHKDWFGEYGALYAESSQELVTRGQQISETQRAEALATRHSLREELHRLMDSHDIDLWISPSALGPAPQGLLTGDPAMNLVWTCAGMPVTTIPSGNAANGLPLGLQIVSRFMNDEELLSWAEGLETALDYPGV